MRKVFWRWQTPCRTNSVSWHAGHSSSASGPSRPAPSSEPGTGAHLFADCVRTIREVPDEEASECLSEKSIFFRGFLAWMTFPPMVLLAFGEPVLLVIIYASLDALFLPFLAITLLILLNSQRVAPEYRNRLVSNVILAISVIPFIVVGVQEVLGSL
jgi:hypothetical protein